MLCPSRPVVTTMRRHLWASRIGRQSLCRLEAASGEQKGLPAHGRDFFVSRKRLGDEGESAPLASRWRSVPRALTCASGAETGRRRILRRMGFPGFRMRNTCAVHSPSPERDITPSVGASLACRTLPHSTTNNSLQWRDPSRHGKKAHCSGRPAAPQKGRARGAARSVACKPRRSRVRLRPLPCLVCRGPFAGGDDTMMSWRPRLPASHRMWRRVWLVRHADSST